MIEASLFERLRDDAGVFAVAAGKVFPVAIPQGGELPCVVYELISQTRNETVCDIASSVLGEYLISSCSKDYFQAKTLANAVRVCLNNFTGPMGLGATLVDRITLLTAQDLVEGEPGMYRVAQTFEIFYQE